MAAIFTLFRWCWAVRGYDKYAARHRVPWVGPNQIHGKKVSITRPFLSKKSNYAEITRQAKTAYFHGKKSAVHCHFVGRRSTAVYFDAVTLCFCLQVKETEQPSDECRKCVMTKYVDYD